MKVVRFTTLLSLVFFFSYGPLEAALPLYSAVVLQTDARGYGLLWSALAVGALIGTLSSTTLRKHLRLSVALPLIAILWGASLLPVVFVDNLWLAGGLLFLGGLMWGPYTPMETTLLQRTIPKAQLGRVFGARSTLLTGGSPLGLAIGGILLAFLPSTVVIGLSALACILVGLGGLGSPTLRSLSLPPADSSSEARTVDQIKTGVALFGGINIVGRQTSPVQAPGARVEDPGLGNPTCSRQVLRGVRNSS
jgi:MFS family permease